MPIDLPSLVAPISAAQPTGKYLRESDTGRALWTTVKDARTAARDAEKRILVPVDPDAPKPAEPEDLQGKIDRGWKVVLSKGETILRDHSKDMSVAAWLAEGLFRSEGFRGLHQGLSLCRELYERYWGSLFPSSTEEDLADGYLMTVDELGKLGESLNETINQIEITDGGRTVEDFIRAGMLPTDPAKREKALQSGRVTLETLAAEGLKTKPERHAQRIQELDDVVSEIYALKAFLDEKAGFNEEGMALAPNLGPLLEQVVKVREAVQFVRGAVTETPAEVTAAPAAGGAATSAPVAVGGLVLTAGSSVNREAVFGELLKIADYFERSEPHSPLPHVLRQAVRWGRMQLPELLTELVGRNDTLTNIALRTGIKVPEENS